MAQVVIFGTGDYARMARLYLTEDSEHEVVAFTVDPEHHTQDELLGLEVVPSDQLADRFPPGEVSMLAAVGYSGVNKNRTAVYERYKDAGYSFVSYVSSKADVWSNVEVGENTFIFEENVLQPFVRVGNNCVLWSGNHIGHDTTIGDNVFIASHAVISGGVTIGDFSFIGVNATFRDAITVGKSNVIGAGAVIMKDTEDGDVYTVRTEVFKKKSWELRGI